jgi:putative chitinase
MNLTAAKLELIAGSHSNASNINSIVVAVARFGVENGLDKPHRLAHFVAQLAEESGGFRYDREIWGPTPAQKRYDTRVDLGNSPEVDGDGKKYAGRGPLQLTGKANYSAFYGWCQQRGYASPNFRDDPDALNTDPWEGLSAIYFWSTRNLNALADENNIEQITRRINGGLNGFAERVHFYMRAGLVLLGYGPDEIDRFQQDAKAAGRYKDKIDGDPGPKTRAAIHMSLVALDHTGEAREIATPAPVVTEKPVMVDRPIAVDVKAPGRGVADAATGAGVGAASLGGVLQQLQQQLTPFSMAGGWIGKLVVVLIIAGGVLTVAGLAWRWYASRKKRETIAQINKSG